jgi:hypothetical protein
MGKLRRAQKILIRKPKRKKLWGCTQKFPDCPPWEGTANCAVLCHYMQLYRYFVSQSSMFCCHNTLCCFSTSVYCSKCIFRYRLSPETFGYTLVFGRYLNIISTLESRYIRSIIYINSFKMINMH